MAGFHNLKTIENQESLVPDVSPDAFAIAPEFDSTEELRVEIDDTDESRQNQPVTDSIIFEIPNCCYCKQYIQHEV